MRRPTIRQIAARFRRGPDIESRVVWILGSGRSGSTWLMNLISATTDAVRMNEPLIGAHLAVPISVGTSVDDPEERTIYDGSRARGSYMFSDETRAVWEPRLRDLILSRLKVELERSAAHTTADTLLIVKEPNGSRASELLVSMTPKSRLIFLLRDGRDVVDSMIDAAGADWAVRNAKVRLDVAHRRDYIERRARRWVATTAATLAAYNAHDPTRRLLITYEQLRADTEVHLTTILRWLGRPFDPKRVSEKCQRLAFEALPDDMRGDGMFHRAATPGLWRDRFTADEHEVLHEIMGPTLAALGYDPD